MHWLRRHLKKFSLALALSFLFGSTLLAAHYHSSLKNEKESNCSICQISHSNTKLVSSDTSFRAVDLKPTHNLFIPNFSEISSEIVLSSLIRGPPFFSHS